MLQFNVHRAHQGLKMDLLPWADPYIMQLFQEAELVGESAAAVPAPAPVCRRYPEVSSAASVDDETRSISSIRRSPLPRRRRTETERLLVRC